MEIALLFIMIMFVFLAFLSGILIIKWHTKHYLLSEEVIATMWTVLMVVVLSTILIFLNWGDLMWR